MHDDVNVFSVPQWFGYVFFTEGVRRETGHDGVVGADFFSLPDMTVPCLPLIVILLPKCVAFRWSAVIVSLIPRGLLVLVGNSFEGCFRAWECAAVAVRDPFQFHELFDRHGDAYVSAIIGYPDVFARYCNQFVVFVTEFVIRIDDLQGHAIHDVRPRVYQPWGSSQTIWLLVGA